MPGPREFTPNPGQMPLPQVLVVSPSVALAQAPWWQVTGGLFLERLREQSPRSLPPSAGR